MIKNILGRIVKIEKRLHQIQCCAVDTGGGGVGTGDFDAIVDFSVNIDPNTPGTTFSPNTPALTTVLYVSTINNSQWVYNGVSYVTYTPSFWRVNGNSGTLGTGKIGPTDGVQLGIITNNVNRIHISAAGSIGFGTTANGLDRTYTLGDSLTSGTIKTNTGVSIGSTPPAIGTYKIHTQDAGTVRFRSVTTSDPGAGLGRIAHEMVYSGTNSGWRYGLNTGGIAGGNYPSMDFTIDELSGPVFRGAFRIQKTTGFVGIGGGNFVNGAINPTEQLDVDGNFRLRGAFMPGNQAGAVGQVLMGQGATNANTWMTFVDEEIPGGTKDGVNTTFTIAHTPMTGSTKLYVRGLRLQLGVDYSIAGTNITILTALLIPGALDTFFIDYKY